MDMEKPPPPIRIEIKKPQETGKTNVSGITCTKCIGLDEENTVLKRKLDEKDGIIRLLCKEIERRDEILDTSRRHEDEADVTVTFSEEGHPVYELKNKEKIPYTIRTEKLVPIILENLVDSFLEQRATENGNSFCSNCKRVNENTVDDEQPSASKRPRLNSSPPLQNVNVNSESKIKPEEPIKNQSVQNEVGEKNPVQSDSVVALNPSTQSKSNDNQKSNSNKSNEKQSNSIKSDKSQSNEKQSNSNKSDKSQSNQRKSDEKKSTSSKSNDRQSDRRKSNEIQSKKSSTENQDSRRKYTENQSKKPSTENQSKKSSTENQDSRRKSTENIYNSKNESLENRRTKSQSSENQPVSLSTLLNKNEMDENFKSGFSEIQDLSDCPIGQKFWCVDKSESELETFSVSVPKLVIRLHDDRRVLEPQDKPQKFTIFQKKDSFLFPRKFCVPYYVMKHKINVLPQKKLWLDVRSFDIFKQDVHDFVSLAVPFITHLSIGYRLSGQREFNLDTLLKFILNWMPNLEYLSINNNCFNSRTISDYPKDESHTKTNTSTTTNTTTTTTSRVKTLENLTTLRLIYSSYTISAPPKFILDIFEKAPKLKHVYGMPLDLLSDKFEDIDKYKHIKFHSVFTLRSLYSFYTNPNPMVTPAQVRYFDRDLSRLSKIDGLALETLDCRSYFIRDSSRRSYCIQDFTKLINMCKESLLKLTLDPLPISSKEQVLQLPHLPKLTELQLDMSRRNHRELCTFFPPDFRISRKLPELSSVELYVDYNTTQEVSKSSRALKVEQRRSHSKHEPSSPSSPSPPPPPAETVAMEMFKKHFPPSSYGSKKPFENVESLILRNFTPWDCIENVSLVFHNIQTLRLCNPIEDICTALPYCFKFFKKVTNLIVEVDMEAHSRNLDSAITGIHPNMCGSLQKSGFHPPDKIQKIIQNNRSRNSICDLENLKYFKIIIRSNSNGQVFKVPVISQVSFIYGLELNKNKVRVEIDFEERMTADDRKYIMTTLMPLRPKIKIND